MPILQSTEVESGLIAYPLAPGCAVDNRLTMQVNGQPVLLEYMNYANFGCIARCAVDEPSSINITSASGAISDLQVRPARHGIVPRVEGNQAHFTLPQPLKLLLEVTVQNAVIPVFLFADPITQMANTENTPGFIDMAGRFELDTTGTSNVCKALQSAIDEATKAPGAFCYFAPGLYKGSGEIFLRSDSSVYLAAGCQFEGFRILVQDSRNVKICGPGTIRGTGAVYSPQEGLIRTDRCSHFEIRDITVLDSPNWTVRLSDSEHIVVSNVKIVNSGAPQTDCVDPVDSRHVLIDNIFAQAGDDGVAVKSFIPGSVTSDIRVQNSVFNILWAGAIKIGTETHGREMSDIIFDTVDILDCGRAFIVMVRDGAHVHDILVKDVVVERQRGDNRKRVIDLSIERRKAPGRIDNVTIREFAALEKSPNPPQLRGLDQDHAITNVAFDNLRIAGEFIHSAHDGGFEMDFHKNVVFRR